jgi:adenine-specific DNA-methyltransferase
MWSPPQKTYLKEKEGKGIWTWWTNSEVGHTQEGTQELASILGKAVFDYPKPARLLTRIFKLAANSDSIILDFFAGSGSTAHAVLNMNKADGGNRKFILVEMMDYADSITAERVKRVIDGYGEGKKAVEGTGGQFSYYELDPVLLLPVGYLNEEMGPQKIREYVYYMETKEPLPAEQPADEPYFMGLCRNTAYYFYYERERVTTLDHAFLSTIQAKAEGYSIYADLCAIPQETLRKHNITFKKIPRDIARL